MKKKMTAVLLTAALAGSLLAGCGGSASSAGSSAAGSSAAASSGSSAAASSSASAASSGSSAAASTGKVIGYSAGSQDTPFFVTEAEQFKQAAEAAGYECFIVDAENSTDKQASDIEDMIARKVDAIIATCVDPEAIVPSTNTVEAAGIPMFAIDRQMGDNAKIVSTIRADSLLTGIAVGQAMGSQFEEGQEVVAAILSGVMGNYTGLQRRTGFAAGMIMARTGASQEDAIAKATELMTQLDKNGNFEDADSNFRCVAQKYGDFTNEGGMNGMEDILTANSDVNCLFSENDAMGSGAVKAIAEFQKTGQVVCGSLDCDKDILDMIEKNDGTYFCSGLNDPYVLGKLAFDTVDAYLNGEEVENNIYMDCVAVTAENIAQYRHD